MIECTRRAPCAIVTLQRGPTYGIRPVTKHHVVEYMERLRFSEPDKTYVESLATITSINEPPLRRTESTNL
jgi:hypothetical protein